MFHDQGWPYVVLISALVVASFWATAFVEVCAVLLIAHFVLAQLGTKGESIGLVRNHLRTSKLFRGMVIFWGVYVIAVLISLVISGRLFSSHAGLAWHPLLFVVVVLNPMASHRIEQLGKIFLGSAAFAAVATLMINLAQGFVPPEFVFTGLTTFADLLCLAAIVALSFMMSSRRVKRERMLCGILALFIAGVVFWTAEFAPLGLLAIAGGLLVASTYPSVLLPWSFLSFGAIFLIPSDIREKVEWLLHGNPIDRYVVWSEGLTNLFRVPLFGYGPGSFSYALPLEAWGRFLNKPPGSWHNDLLQTWFDDGPVASAALSGLLVLCVWLGIAMAFGRRDAAGRVIPKTTLLLLICLIGFGMVGSVITTAVLGALWWIVMGLAVQAWLGSSRTSPVSENLSR